MAHFAELDENNVVLRVIVVHNNDCLDQDGNESEAVGAAFCTTLLGGRWVQTSYNANFRKRYAGIGFTYDNVRDAFIPPRPYASWVFVEDTCDWAPPVPYPNDDKSYDWDETSLGWVEIQNF